MIVEKKFDLTDKNQYEEYKKLLRENKDVQVIQDPTKIKVIYEKI